MTAKNMKELAKQIEQMATKAMQQGSNVKDTVIETGKKHVEEDVYDVYKPKQYERTGQLKDSWEVEDTVDGISVQNMRVDEETGKYVAYTVETGKGYDYNFPYADKERPFTENTREELRGSKELSDALEQDLRKMGIKTK